MIQVEDLTIDFPTERGARRVVDGVSFSLTRGKTLGIVGESGSGKSLTALALLGLVPRPGRIARGARRKCRRCWRANTPSSNRRRAAPLLRSCRATVRVCGAGARGYRRRS
jgi:ABC-type dipeptide/oligopeptide/nickel transport system ATPase component